MTKNKTLAASLLTLLLSLLLLFLFQVATDPNDGGQSGDGHEESEEVSLLALDQEARAAAGIQVEEIWPRPMRESLGVPGVLTTDAYRTAKVAPRIGAQIIARHVRLGDEVVAGTPLVTLSSVDMAEAQGDLLVSEQEWARVQSLGREIVSERRYIEADVSHQRARARLIAFGMTDAQVESLADTADASMATGRFQLLAPRDGTVILDEFVIGDFVGPGRVLFEITDESSLWVEASLSADEAATLDPLSMAVVVVGDRRILGDVVQQHHRVDEETRRQLVRVQIQNADDDLHPGQFVTVELSFGETEPKLAVPTEAIVLLSGNPSVFVAHDDGDFEPLTVGLGQARDGWTAITSGLSPGDEVVVSGAFHLKSLLLRSQLGSGHGH